MRSEPTRQECHLGNRTRCGRWGVAFVAALVATIGTAHAQDQGFTTTIEPATQTVKSAKKPASKATDTKAAVNAGKTNLPASGADTAIVVVVNDEPISNFNVDQRVALNALSGNQDAQERLRARLKAPGIQDQFRAFAIKFNPKSKEEVVALQRKFVENIRRQVMSEVKPGARDKALMELINERLKVQEAKRLELQVTDEELKDMVGDLAKRNNKSAKDFEAMLASQGIGSNVFRERLRAEASWQRVLQRRFVGQLTIANSEVEQEIGKVEAAVPAGPQLLVQRAVMAQSANDQAAMATNYALAEKLQTQAKGCKNFESLAKATPGVKFENLGTITANVLSEQVRPIVASAKAGDVLPPMLTATGIEVYAVCKVIAVKPADGKANAKADGEPEPEAQAATPDQKREKARSTLQRTKLAVLSKSLLSDLCAKASIDFRNGASTQRVCGSE